MNEEGKIIKVPKAITKMLLADEQAMAIIRQSRLKAATTPDSIIITNQRIIRYSPSTLGLHKEIEDYRYEDIANLKIEKGILFATITLRRRFMSDPYYLSYHTGQLLPTDFWGMSTLSSMNQEHPDAPVHPRLPLASLAQAPWSSSVYSSNSLVTIRHGSCIEFQGHHTSQAYYKSGIMSPECHQGCSIPR